MEDIKKTANMHAAHKVDKRFGYYEGLWLGLNYNFVDCATIEDRKERARNFFIDITDRQLIQPLGADTLCRTTTAFLLYVGVWEYWKDSLLTEFVNFKK